MSPTVRIFLIMMVSLSTVVANLDFLGLGQPQQQCPPCICNNIASQAQAQGLAAGGGGGGGPSLGGGYPGGGAGRANANAAGRGQGYGG